MVSWAEPSLREVSYRAAWSQMRSDRRRQQEAANRREHRREMKCELAAFAGILVTMAVCYAVAWWLWALVGA